ncbi:RNA polymerase sigma factor [Bizionia sediminis]|uniref:RNA polymerase sigma factor n=1 Tax=Bizionia sediminis TaxID=1737064 RepID=A0ABW5KS73_9FLAO
MITPTETEIINFLKNGDTKAMPLLYDNYADALFSVISKILKDPDLAQDALQETFIKVWKKGRLYDPNKAKLFTWLFRIAHNTAIDKVRSINKKLESEIQIDTTNVHTITVASFNQDVMDIHSHLNSLEEKYQVVIKALFFEGMTQEEASKELNMPLGTVKSRLKIGLRELKKIYNPETSSDAN